LITVGQIVHGLILRMYSELFEHSPCIDITQIAQTSGILCRRVCRFAVICMTCMQRCSP